MTMHEKFRSDKRLAKAANISANPGHYNQHMLAFAWAVLKSAQGNPIQQSIVCSEDIHVRNNNTITELSAKALT